MKRLRRAWRRLAGSFTGNGREAELADEFASHIRLLTEENIERGTSPAEARRAALVTFGGVEWAKEGYRDQRGFWWIASLRQDLRYTFRGMRRSPGFTAAAMVCLALGIGANTAVFSLINAVMIRSLPVSHPEQLELLRYQRRLGFQAQNITCNGYCGASDNTSLSLPYPPYETVRKGTRTLSGVLAFVPLGFSNHNVTVSKGGDPGTAGAVMVSGNYFSLLGVAPILGRAITEDDFEPGAPNVAVIRYGYWSREFGGENSAIGRNIALNGAPFTIVGVAPPDFAGVDSRLLPDIWVPLRDMAALKPWGISAADDERLFQAREHWWCMMIGRRRLGIGEQQARAELDALFLADASRDPEHVPSPSATPRIALRSAARGLEGPPRGFAESLRILSIAVALVLLIACANVATLLVARAESRQKEVGVRLAMGASRERLVRQFLTESALLALGGGALGLALARWGSRALLLLMSGSGRETSLDIRPDATVLGFTAGVAMLTAVLFGLAPALAATRVEVASQLKESARSISSRALLGKALVAAQVALSVCLLMGAGLFVRTLQNLVAQDFGFNRERLLLFQLDPERAGLAQNRVVETYRAALEKIQALPGVRSATVSQSALLSGWMSNNQAYPDGDPPPDADRSVHYNIVGPDFFQTMGIRIVLGQGIGWHEMSGHRVAVVNEAMARRLFPKGNPLGRHFSLGGKYDPAKAYYVIGVARNAKFESVRGDSPPTAYLPYTAAPYNVGAMWFEVRTAGDPLEMTAALRQTMRSLDARLPLMDVKTQGQQIDEALAQERMFARISSCFGLLALLLVAVGVYGTIGYAVARRSNEIGIRMALGAGRRRVRWMVLRESLLVVGCGLAVGMPAALVLTRYVASMLFGVKQYDAATIAVTLAILAGVGALAGLLPADRATRIDPMKALRCE